MRLRVGIILLPVIIREYIVFLFPASSEARGEKRAEPFGPPGPGAASAGLGLEYVTQM